MSNPDSSLDERLQANGYEVVRRNDALDGAELGKFLDAEGFNVLFKRNGGVVTEETVKIGRELFYVGLCCVGDESVKGKPNVLREGVLFQNSPEGNANSVKELVMGSMIDLARQLSERDAAMRRGEFVKDNRGRELKGSRLGILGYGNIGAQVVDVAKAFGMEVFFYDNHPRFADHQANGVKKVDSVQELFELCDVVTVHASQYDHEGKRNESLVSAENLAAFASKADLKGGKEPLKFVLNLARANLVDLAVLQEAAHAGHVKGIALDVFPSEPETAKDRKNWQHPLDEATARITLMHPHIGASTAEAQGRVAEEAETRAKDFLEKGKLGMVYGNGMLRREELAIPGWSHVHEPRVQVVHAPVPGSRSKIEAALSHHFGGSAASVSRDFRDNGTDIVGVSVMTYPHLNPNSVSAETMKDIVDEVEKAMGGDNPIKTVRLMRAPQARKDS